MKCVFRCRWAGNVGAIIKCTLKLHILILRTRGQPSETAYLPITKRFFRYRGKPSQMTIKTRRPRIQGEEERAGHGGHGRVEILQSWGRNRLPLPTSPRGATRGGERPRKLGRGKMGMGGCSTTWGGRATRASGIWGSTTKRPGSMLNRDQTRSHEDN